jgi:hypothetical protein
MTLAMLQPAELPVVIDRRDSVSSISGAPPDRPA